MTTETISTPSTWTWADQVSSWRFWGLLIFYILTVSSVHAALNLSLPLFLQTMDYTAETFSYVIMARQIATGAGLSLAWVAIKWRPRVSLMILAALEICGLVLLLGLGDATPLGSAFAGSALIGLSTGAIALTIPAILAAGRGGAEAFLVTFGLVSILGIGGETLARLAMSLGINAWGSDTLIYLAAIPAILGTILLLSVDPHLFSGPLPERGYALSPRRRKPILTALLVTFVPFYVVYWLYRLHGEVAAVAPSRILLSPRGALFCTLFVPLLPFVALASLIEALNRKRRELNHPPLRSPVTTYLWALLFPPAAVYMIQSGLNRFLAEQAEPTTE